MRIDSIDMYETYNIASVIAGICANEPDDTDYDRHRLINTILLFGFIQIQ